MLRNFTDYATMLIFLPKCCETLRITQRWLFRRFRREQTRSKANRKYSQTKLGYDKYKVMNSCASRVLLNPQRGETTLFITDMTKANVSLPRTIKWDEVTLPEKFLLDKRSSSNKIRLLGLILHSCQGHENGCLRTESQECFCPSDSLFCLDNN